VLLTHRRVNARLRGLWLDRLPKLANVKPDSLSKGQSVTLSFGPRVSWVSDIFSLRKTRGITTPPETSLGFRIASENCLRSPVLTRKKFTSLVCPNPFSSTRDIHCADLLTSTQRAQCRFGGRCDAANTRSSQKKSVCDWLRYTPLMSWRPVWGSPAFSKRHLAQIGWATWQHEMVSRHQKGFAREDLQVCFVDKRPGRVTTGFFRPGAGFLVN